MTAYCNLFYFIASTTKGTVQSLFSVSSSVSMGLSDTITCLVTRHGARIRNSVCWILELVTAKKCSVIANSQTLYNLVQYALGRGSVVSIMTGY
jgi:hypothetical protein